MPRRLLRNGEIVEDEWRYAADAEVQPHAAAAGQAAGAAHAADPVQAAGAGASPLILRFDQWQAERAQWIANDQRRLGVILSPAHQVDQLAPDLARFELVGAEFSGPSEGRGYTQGRLLRERWNFQGELRAAGYVHRDQLFFLARCGFNSFELPESELAHALAALSTFSAAYQPTNDAGLPLKLPRRLRDTPASA
jgi:uncharacterized protein (DUF934 family)